MAHQQSVMSSGSQAGFSPVPQPPAVHHSYHQMPARAGVSAFPVPAPGVQYQNVSPVFLPNAARGVYNSQQGFPPQIAPQVTMLGKDGVLYPTVADFRLGSRARCHSEASRVSPGFDGLADCSSKGAALSAAAQQEQFALHQQYQLQQQRAAFPGCPVWTAPSGVQGIYSGAGAIMYPPYAGGPLFCSQPGQAQAAAALQQGPECAYVMHNSSNLHGHLRSHTPVSASRRVSSSSPTCGSPAALPDGAATGEGSPLAGLQDNPSNNTDSKDNLMGDEEGSVVPDRRSPSSEVISRVTPTPTGASQAAMPLRTQLSAAQKIAGSRRPPPRTCGSASVLNMRNSNSSTDKSKGLGAKKDTKKSLWEPKTSGISPSPTTSVRRSSRPDETSSSSAQRALGVARSTLTQLGMLKRESSASARQRAERENAEGQVLSTSGSSRTMKAGFQEKALQTNTGGRSSRGGGVGRLPIHSRQTSDASRKGGRGSQTTASIPSTTTVRTRPGSRGVATEPHSELEDNDQSAGLDKPQTYAQRRGLSVSALGTVSRQVTPENGTSGGPTRSGKVFQPDSCRDGKISRDSTRRRDIRSSTFRSKPPPEEIVKLRSVVSADAKSKNAGARLSSNSNCSSRYSSGVGTTPPFPDAEDRLVSGTSGASKGECSRQSSAASSQSTQDLARDQAVAVEYQQVPRAVNMLEQAALNAAAYQGESSVMVERTKESLEPGCSLEAMMYGDKNSDYVTSQQADYSTDACRTPGGSDVSSVEGTEVERTAAPSTPGAEAADASERRAGLTSVPLGACKHITPPTRYQDTSESAPLTRDLSPAVPLEPRHRPQMSQVSVETQAMAADAIQSVGDEKHGQSVLVSDGLTQASVKTVSSSVSQTARRTCEWQRDAADINEEAVPYRQYEVKEADLQDQVGGCKDQKLGRIEVAQTRVVSIDGDQTGPAVVAVVQRRGQPCTHIDVESQAEVANHQAPHEQTANASAKGEMSFADRIQQQLLEQEGQADLQRQCQAFVQSKQDALYRLQDASLCVQHAALLKGQPKNLFEQQPLKKDASPALHQGVTPAQQPGLQQASSAELQNVIQQKRALQQMQALRQQQIQALCQQKEQARQRYKQAVRQQQEQQARHQQEQARQLQEQQARQLQEQQANKQREQARQLQEHQANKQQEEQARQQQEQARQLQEQQARQLQEQQANKLREQARQQQEQQARQLQEQQARQLQEQQARQLQEQQARQQQEVQARHQQEQARQLQEQQARQLQEEQARQQQEEQARHQQEQARQLQEQQARQLQEQANKLREQARQLQEQQARHHQEQARQLQEQQARQLQEQQANKLREQARQLQEQQARQQQEDQARQLQEQARKQQEQQAHQLQEQHARQLQEQQARQQQDQQMPQLQDQQMPQLQERQMPQQQEQQARQQQDQEARQQQEQQVLRHVHQQQEQALPQVQQLQQALPQQQEQQALPQQQEKQTLRQQHVQMVLRQEQARRQQLAFHQSSVRLNQGGTLHGTQLPIVNVVPETQLNDKFQERLEAAQQTQPESQQLGAVYSSQQHFSGIKPTSSEQRHRLASLVSTLRQKEGSPQDMRNDAASDTQRIGAEMTAGQQSMTRMMPSPPLCQVQSTAPRRHKKVNALRQLRQSYAPLVADTPECLLREEEETEADHHNENRPNRPIVAPSAKGEAVKSLVSRSLVSGRVPASVCHPAGRRDFEIFARRTWAEKQRAQIEDLRRNLALRQAGRPNGITASGMSPAVAVNLIQAGMAALTALQTPQPSVAQSPQRPAQATPFRRTAQHTVTPAQAGVSAAGPPARGGAAEAVSPAWRAARYLGAAFGVQPIFA